MSNKKPITNEQLQKKEFQVTESSFGNSFGTIRQEVEDMLTDVAYTYGGDYKVGYQQAILNVLSLLDYYNCNFKP